MRFEKDGEEKSELVKIGWGEFSAQTFTKDKKSHRSDFIPENKQGKDYHYVAEHEVIRNLPFDIYCVSQRESFFANEKIQKEMCSEPEKYLKKHAIFVARSGEVVKATKIDFDKSELDYDIVPISEKDALESIDQARELYVDTVNRLSQQK